MRPIPAATQPTAAWWTATALAGAILASGCSVKTYAINMVGNALASGNSVYETDDDIDLVGDALPFGLKLTESLLAQSPNHAGLLLTACRGFVLYAYAYVDYPAPPGRRRRPRSRARAARPRPPPVPAGLPVRHPVDRALVPWLRGHPPGRSGRGRSCDAPSRRRTGRTLLYWTAAALGLAIAVSPDDAALLARLPEVQALLDRAIALDETWDDGALHEFKVTLAGAAPGEPDVMRMTRHYERAVELSKGRSAGAYLAYAEAVSVPRQNAAEFRRLIEQALAVDPDADPKNRLVNLLAHRRARWLASRADELFLESAPAAAEGQ